ncbi:hypothetical protein SFA35_17465 [Pseudomonas sp. HR96]|uniref:hypothetical protein n=1 Tax=Pseudomonas sp. HR96 TaxID=1027966 RepID=UPI002A751709|nr:hypothetical protein [Pseudomonas sp. HR96]WPO98419.1 hypothetical protein SFA35_17465 [Pseudomonas sp. HR96]
MTKYVIRYKLDGERRWDFAHLATGSLEEASAALAQIHGDEVQNITEIHVSKAL